ncbi:MAG: peptidylprolyl isomerase [Bacteroidales bacterium]
MPYRISLRRGYRGAVVLVVCALLTTVGVEAQSVNKFNDPVIREIHDLADRREAAGLLPFLRSDNPEYRGEALFCFGSLQDPGLIDSLYEASQVDQPRVRQMGAWALGQTYHQNAVPVIRKFIDNEKDPLVRGILYEALGKCGGEEEMEYLAGIQAAYEEREGLSAGLLRLALRGIQSPGGNSLMVNLLMEGTTKTGSIYASYHLARYADMAWLQLHPDSILLAFTREHDPLIRANLIKAVIRAQDEKAWPLCKMLLESEEDYRVKVGVLTSMRLIPWNKAVGLVLKIVGGEHAALSVAAAEAVQAHAVYTDLAALLKAIDATKNWRSRSILLGKTLELVAGKPALVKRVEKMILASAESAKSPVERAWYLRALEPEPRHYAYLESLLKRGAEAPVYTACLETLGGMRKKPNFDQASKELAASGIDLEQEIRRILGTYPMPVDPKPGYGHPIDWERVARLSPKQKVAIRTTKGDLFVQLNVNWCPATCAAFVGLIEEGFYRNLAIHRVVPNFVVQDGCPRGDGWGGPDWTIRSEFTPTPFMEGTLGMASSGKDTEGSQWYVTHSPTPHLDGKYTNFGFVVAGMEVVHQLEVGDVIIGMELLRE